MKPPAQTKPLITSRSIYKDGRFLSLTLLAFGITGFTIIWALTHIKQTEIQIPIRFSSLTNFDQLGAWYQLYEIPAMALIVVGANFALANLLHRRNRLVSIFFMMVAVMAAILATAILIGFTEINYGTT